MFKIVVLVSGNGSNLQALINNCIENHIAGNIVGVYLLFYFQIYQ